MKISVIGAGYVGLSLAVLLSQKHEVVILEIDLEKVSLINKKKSPIKDIELEKYLETKNLNIFATSNREEAYSDSDYTIVATPTNYDELTSSFDTSSVEDVIKECVKINPKSIIVIKSTVPLGFTDQMKNLYKEAKIFFSPEFLRESKALWDNLYPARIVIGDNNKESEIFGKTLIDCSNKNLEEVPFFKMTSSEAESVKLFANTFLAMRVAFFNELDSFCETQDLSSKKIIKGICSDERIGNYYNNPSFGYGGYCLPKDTKQLLDNFSEIPNNIIQAVVQSNQTRKNFIVSSIMSKSPNTVGVYRLIMKDGSDNFRESAVIDILDKLQQMKVGVLLYEPFIQESHFRNIEVVSDLNLFISRSDLIIANRLSSDLEDVGNKVYSRDIFQEN
tara:strand:- start:30 stop:1202 length:1173 start_codon:yes stop_codon:yes gene_type:complete